MVRSLTMANANGPADRPGGDTQQWVDQQPAPAAGKGEPPPAADAPTLAPSAPAAPAAADGPAVAGYEVLGELGRGGMGVVYQARQAGLNRLVALKMILAGAHAGPDDVARFKAEAEAVARLQHPGIVQVHEVGDHDGLPFFSLEFVPGGSLAQRLHGTPLPPRQAAALVARLAPAVHAAHRAGIVHRDLKPANVLLQEGPEVPVGDCTPKVTDFGLAKQLDSQHGRTRSGAILGTPSYMAPEQAGGRKGDVGPAADVYALGAILYECLTGRPPFTAETPLDTVLQVLSDEPVPPGRLVPKLPRDVETVCLKCLQKDPHKRYAGADRLADDLEAYLDGRPIAARPVGRVERAWRWCRRNRALAAAAALVALALVAGSVVSTAFGIRASVNAKQARQAQEAAQAHAEEALRAQEAAQAAQAEEARQRATNHKQLIDLLVSNGNRLLREDDPGAALPWFAAAADRDQQDSRHAGRLDGALTLLPRPTYLWRHGPAINALAVSPDGRRAVTGSDDGTARLWDLDTGEPVGPPLKNDNAILAVAFSPDGKRVATAGGTFGLTGEVRAWDAATGAAVGRPLPLFGTGVFVGFSADGTRLVAGVLVLGNLLQGRFEPRLTARMLQAATGEVLGEAAFYTRDNSPMAGGAEPYVHAGTGRVLVVTDRRATVIDLAVGKPVGPPVVHRQAIRFARLSADGGRAITIDTGGVGKVRELATGQVRDLAVGYDRQPLDAAVNGRGEVAVAFADGAVQRYRLADGRPAPGSLHRVGAAGWQPRFDADAVLVTGLHEETARVWEVDGGQPLAPVLRHGGTVTGSAPAADGRRLLVGTHDGSVRLWDLALTRAEQPTIAVWKGVPRGARVEYDPAAGCLVLGEGRVLRYVDNIRGTGEDAAPVEPAAPTTVLSPDRSRLAVGTRQKVVRLLDAATLREVGPRLKHVHPYVLDAVFSRDGRLLATRDAAAEAEPIRLLGEAHLWDLATGKELPATPLRMGSLLEPGGISCIAFSPDGRWFAAAGGRATLGGVRGEVRLHEAATGKPAGKPLPVSSGKFPVRLAFSPNGRLLAVLSLTPTLKSGELALWDVEAGKPVLVPPVLLTGRPHDCAFDPSGNRLAVAAGSVLQVWDPAAARLVQLLPHPGEVGTVRYQQGGRVLLSIADRDSFHGVHLWDADTGEALRPPVRTPGPVGSAAVAFDGRFLVTVGDQDWDRVVRFWDLAADPGRGEERGRLARLLSCQEVAGTTALPVAAARLVADWEHLHRQAPDLLVPAESQVLQWHALRADRLLSAEHWAVAARQLDQLTAREPDNQGWHLEAGGCYLAVGDRDGLRRHAEALLRLNREATNLVYLDWTLETCLLAPDVLPDPAPALRLAERLEKAGPADGHYPWALVNRGVALYRAGRFDAAAGWLEKARALKKAPPHRVALAGLFLAMVRGKQGRADEARKLLAEAGRLVERVEKEPWNYGWLDRVQCRAAWQEAKTTVGAP
jgi:WD40 repeat protein